ncbi:MAG TPA: hypothetical protein VFG23_24435 [Polyangia bacterium]|nr:hypothetical protein [Polyangia bacterium]
MGQPVVGFRRRNLRLIPDLEPEAPLPWRRIASEVRATIALLQPELARTIRPFLPNSARGEELVRRLEAPIAIVVGGVHHGRLHLGKVLRDWLAPAVRDREPDRLARW